MERRLRWFQFRLQSFFVIAFVAGLFSLASRGFIREFQQRSRPARKPVGAIVRLPILFDLDMLREPPKMPLKLARKPRRMPRSLNGDKNLGIQVWVEVP